MRQEELNQRLLRAVREGTEFEVSNALEEGADARADTYLAVRLAARLGFIPGISALLLMKIFGCDFLQEKARCAERAEDEGLLALLHGDGDRSRAGGEPASVTAAVLAESSKLARALREDPGIPVGNLERMVEAVERHAGAARLLAADLKQLNERLVDAALSGNSSDVRKALWAGADVHTNQDAALRLAADRGDSESVRVLLKEGADVHALGEYALDAAVFNGHAETVKALLEGGAGVHVNGDKPLLGWRRGSAICPQCL